ncbi:sigma factor regulator N-terminal domain-containing protein [Lacticaseibacillus absianus]|uniref:sigma factor regulator N-terminal domain-containing protein n=1 Tax=Lacticaseibacillus absianus TaxID=2729623 RepID=UPI0015C90AA6|nr:sigma factor regulator N-terminal domain-containing protein [Lacticaseibacillus absianus]
MDLEHALRRAKTRQLVKNLVGALLVVLLIGGGSLAVVDRLAAHQMQQLFDQLLVYHQVAEPNVAVSNEQLTNAGLASGQVVTNEYKLIAGIPVPWRTLTSQFATLSHQVDQTIGHRHALNVGDTGAADQTQSYTLDGQKIANFYTASTATLPNEGLRLAGMTNTYGELALTFDAPLTLAEIKHALPRQITLCWGYILDDPSTATNGLQHVADPLGVDLTAPLDYSDWRHYLAQYWRSYGPQDANVTAYRTAMAATAKTVRFKGVMVTGSAAALVTAAKLPIVAGSSVGVTVQPKPYQHHD